MEFEGGLKEGKRVETGVEFARLKRVIERIIVPGGSSVELEQLLREEPQRDQRGNLRYLITAGQAVELVTGYQRDHHDLDIVLFDPEDEDHWEIYGTDNVTPEWYWADMTFNPTFLDQTARKTITRPKGGLKVEVVHPAILLVQKSSDAFGRPPRPKDENDIHALVGHWKRREGRNQTWIPIMQTSIDALPRRQQATTAARIRGAIK